MIPDIEKTLQELNTNPVMISFVTNFFKQNKHKQVLNFRDGNFMQKFIQDFQPVLESGLLRLQTESLQAIVINTYKAYEKD